MWGGDKRKAALGQGVQRAIAGLPVSPHGPMFHLGSRRIPQTGPTQTPDLRPHDKASLTLRLELADPAIFGMALDPGQALDFLPLD